MCNAFSHLLNKYKAQWDMTSDKMLHIRKRLIIILTKTRKTQEEKLRQDSV